MAQYSAVSGDGNSGGDTNSVNVGVAGTPAAGDFLILHVLNQRAENTWATPTGWTLIGSQVNGAAAFYKIAAGGESSVTVTKTGTTGRCIGNMLLLTPTTAGATLSLNTSNTDTDLTVSTVTPTLENTCWVWLAGRSTDSTDFSAYAMATDDPTWTERYENDSAGQCSIAGATSTLRTATSATGNLTATGTGGDSGIILAVGEVANASPAPAALTLTTAQPASTITTSSNISVSAFSLTATQNAPTVTSQEFPVATNPDKNTATATNPDKNTASATNPDKSSTTVTNIDKTQ